MIQTITANWEWFLLALYVIEKAIKLSPSKKDDLVWTVPNTFAASANAALYCGAKVDFVDINPLKADRFSKGKQNQISYEFRVIG